MSAAMLVAGAALDGASTLLYLQVARLTLRTLPRGRDHSAEAFALFWYAVAAVNAMQAGLALAAVFAEPGLPLAFAVWNTRIVLALIAFAGLVYYLLYVYTGTPATRAPLIAFYGAVFLLMQVWIMQAQPTGTDVRGWRVDLEFAQPAQTPLYRLVVVLFFVPPLVAAAAYALLPRRMAGAQQRRARLLAWGLGAYFAGMTAGYLASGWVWWGLLENLLGLGAGLVAIYAFRPSASSRALVRPLGDDAFARRLRDLV